MVSKGFRPTRFFASKRLLCDFSNGPETEPNSQTYKSLRWVRGYVESKQLLYNAWEDKV